MEQIAKRRRGRPAGSVSIPRDVESGIWIAVLLARVAIRQRTGKTPSVRQACCELAAQGGVVSAVGGNRDALVQANAQLKRKLHRLDVGSTGLPRPNSEGSNFASHVISDAGSLAAAYSKADIKVRTEKGLRLAWMNVARQMRGLAPKRISPGGRLGFPSEPRNFVAI